MQRLTIDRAFLAEAAEAFAALGMNDHASRISAVLGAPDATPVACAHEWTDDGEFTLTCTKCSKKENHEPYGWVQTRGDAINHFTQEWDVVESWVERGFEYKAMFDHAECDREKTDAQPQGEPVAWTWVGENYERGVTLRWDVAKHLPFPVSPLYAGQSQGAPVAWMYEMDGMVHNEQFKPVFSLERQEETAEPWSETALYDLKRKTVAVGIVKMNGDMKCIAFGDDEWKALNVGDIIFTTGARV